MGDFNINLLNEANDNNVKNFVNNLAECSFIPVITKPTRVQNSSATLIDHIWVNFEQPEGLHSHVMFSGITDHFPTIFHYAMNETCPKKEPITYRQGGEANDNLFRLALENTNFNDVLYLEDVNQAFKQFNDIIVNIYNECYPIITKLVPKYNIKNPWITPAIKQSIKKKNKLYKKFVKKPISLGHLYRTYRNHLTKIIKYAKNNYYKEKFINCNGNIRETWKVINKNFRQK